jgi:hypothetical protein
VVNAAVDIGTVVDVLTLGVVALGLVLWRSFGSGVEQAAKDQATESVTRRNWPRALARELERLRGTERQERRFISYGKLWAEMRPLAIYGTSRIDGEAMSGMSTKLSDWYFSETGGLMLTRHNRDLYFALQDLVSAVAEKPEWQAERIRRPRPLFEGILQARGLAEGKALLDHLDGVDVERWPEALEDDTVAAWRPVVEQLAEAWEELDPRERFAVLQQVCSVLRTGLTYDVESRLR